MSLETPEKIRNLQRKLYCKAKAEPVFRFYLLYDKICREDILRHAYALARANAGAPGVDGVTFEQIDASGVDAWLAGLHEELVSKTYRPDPVRRVMIPKPGGGERALGIPSIRCRVIQTAAKLVLEPIFEADFEDSAYGYRPRRSAVDAVKETHRLIRRGYTADVAVERGSVVLTKIFNASSCAALKKLALPPMSKLVRPSIPRCCASCGPCRRQEAAQRPQPGSSTRHRAAQSRWPAASHERPPTRRAPTRSVSPDPLRQGSRLESANPNPLSHKTQGNSPEFSISQNYVGV